MDYEAYYQSWGTGLTPPFRRIALCSAILLLSVTALAAQAAEELGTVMVTDEMDAQPGATESVVPGSGGSTRFQVGRDGIEQFAAPEGGNSYSAVSTLPGVKAQSVDAYGYVNQMGGNKGLRVRGVNATHGANGTVEGVPLTPIGPGPGYLWLFEQENIDSVTLTQGPVAPDQLDYYSTHGALDTGLRWPEAERGGEIGVSIGNDSFMRGFMRFDTGESTSGGKAFVSASSVNANKWRGEGQAPDDDQHYSLGFEQPLGDLTARAYLTHAEGQQYHYRGLNYDQATDLSEWRNYDYSDDPADLQDYYRHNRQDFDNWALLSQFEYRFNPDTTLTLTPFYSKEEGYYLSATTSPGKVRKWLIDHETKGIRADIATRYEQGEIKAGYQYTTMAPPGPPTAWKMYKADANGNLSFAAWSLLADVTEDHTFNNFYLMGSREMGALTLEGGLRYMVETMPSLAFYDKTGIGDVSYSEALAQSSGIIDGGEVSGDDLDAWLPYAALTYALNPELELRAAVGRSVGAPALSAWIQYQSYYSAFTAAGVTAQDMMKGMELETSNNLDLSLRWETESFYLEPTLFYADFSNRSVTFYDPAVGVSYPQSVGDGHQLGAQLAAGWFPRSDLELFGSASYTRAVFDKNLLTAGGATLEVKGNQLPDVPLWMANLGLRWKHGSYSLSPVLRFVGSRYADSAHTEKVDDYATLDLRGGYRVPTAGGELELSLAAVNLFDKEYIGRINAGDVQNAGGYTYYPGAPRTFVASVSYRF